MASFEPNVSPGTRLAKLNSAIKYNTSDYENFHGQSLLYVWDSHSLVNCELFHKNNRNIRDVFYRRPLLIKRTYELGYTFWINSKTEEIDDLDDLETTRFAEKNLEHLQVFVQKYIMTTCFKFMQKMHFW